MTPSIMANLPSALTRSVLAIGAAGAACVGYGVFVEHDWYRSATYRLEILPPPATEPLTILHLSDLHFVRKDRKKRAFLASLPRPDIAVVTGDFLAEPEGVEIAVQSVGAVRGRVASYFVLGSNDYFVPVMIDPFDYLWKHRTRHRSKPNRWRDLVAGLEADGWTFLRNAKAGLRQDGLGLEVVGLDDPHIKRHDLRVAPRSRPEDFGLAIVHSPDPAPELVALGYQLILAGHTHGGQVRFPIVGAVLTNGTTPTKLAMGLARLGPSLLHVSPGLGTSKFAPFRFLCRPEATFLELAPRAAAPDGH